MTAIPVKAVMTTVGEGGTPLYRLLTKNPRHLSESDILMRLGIKSGMEISKARYWMDNLKDVIFEALSANETVDCGFLFAKIYPTGTISSMMAQPTKAENPVKGIVYFKGSLAQRLAMIDLINETQTVNPIIYEVQQDGVEGLNRIESTTARVVINVNRGKIDSTQADNGIWLENLKTSAKVADATVLYSDSSTCHITFPTLPATGKYRLVIATRNGESPEEYVLARATRNVEVVNEEEA